MTEKEVFVRFDLKADDIPTFTEKLIASHKAHLDNFVAIPAADVKPDTLRALAEQDMNFATNVSSATFPYHMSSDKAVREAGAEAENTFEKYMVEVGQREDVFNQLEAFEKRINDDKDLKATLTPEEIRYVQRELRDFRRQGLSLPKEKRERLVEVKKRLAELCTKYSQCLNEDDTKHSFTKEELEGMPDDYISSLSKDGDSKYFVSLKYPDVVPLMQKCKVEATRKRMDFLNQSKCQEHNVGLFQEALTLRKELATLLGYSTYADYKLEVKMAKTSKTVFDFMDDMKVRLKPYAEKERAHLIELKKKEKEARGEDFDNNLNSWDMQYYHTLQRETEYNVKDELISEYFPLPKVIDGLLEIYQQILGLKFVEAPTLPVWHEECRPYAVYNNNMPGQEEKLLGHFWLDLHPRLGKFGHAAVFPLQPRGKRADKTVQLPACAMLCNFTKPTADKPSLLKFEEVVTFFHEFGHCMHGLCTEVDVAFFSGTNVEGDFVEAPSQMLENWCYQEAALALLSGHFQDNTKPLPAELRESLVKAKNVDTGMMNLRQLFFASFDMTCHSQKEGDAEINSGETWAKLRKEITLIDQPKDTNPSANFGHLMGGYEAGYYGYMYSEVFSADMFSVFEASSGGVLDKEIGKRYRECILAPGGTVDGLDMVKNFLGREPNNAAFLKHIGLTA
eukprot:TRINITY_DN65647_c8_g12_i1.p1 TRINITY_DN65647_c8_g12~~TRINITY_DN65647_c8_g12_i1.p1  ORF type:complete len:678 (+),score=97.27 TRINITY_DN65647_c8_g12_i1:48-2081(+)